MKRILLILLIGVFALTGCSGSKDENSLTISGKKYTEQIILASMLEQLIMDRTDIDVINRGDLGSTDVLHQGMLDGDLDMYVEYTGTAYLIVLKEELDTTDPQIIYDRVKDSYDEEYGMTWLTPFEFSNTYCMAVRAETADELGLEKISDIKEYAGDLKLVSSFDFLEREDGAQNFNETYNLTWKDHRGMDPGLMYSAIKEKQVDGIIAFATDGRIPRFDLKILEDDLGFFPPYYPAPVITNEALERFPELADIVAELAPHMTMEKMSELNAKTDIDNTPESQVARDFLIEIGLIAK